MKMKRRKRYVSYENLLSATIGNVVLFVMSYPKCITNDLF